MIPRSRKMGRTAAASVFAALVLVGAALADVTYYVGTPTSYEQLGQGWESTASTALRDTNSVRCTTTCHVDTRYYSGSLGALYTKSWSGSNQYTENRGTGSSYYKSQCRTTVGWGTNLARCWTYWHV